MCVGCAMAAATAASGFRTWLQNWAPRWLTPRRMRALTVGALCAAGIVASIGVSGSVRVVPRHAAGRAAGVQAR